MISIDSRTKALLCVGGLAFAFAFGGCGSGEDNAAPDPSEAQKVTEAMLDAARVGNLEGACEYLGVDGLSRYKAAEESLNQLFGESTPPGSCESQLGGSILSRFAYEASDLTVSPDGRQVALRVHNDEQLSNIPFLLEPEGGEWQITMIGIQDDRATNETLELVEEGGFNPEQHTHLYLP